MYLNPCVDLSIYIYMTSYFWPLKSSDANLMKLPKLLCQKKL